MRVRRLAVVVGPDAGVDREDLAVRCEAWARAVDAVVELRCCDSATATTNAVAGAAGDGIVVCPGAAEVDPPARAELVWVDLCGGAPTRPPWADAPGAACVRGRGIEGFGWALRWLARRIASPPRTIPYGGRPAQFGDLRLPGGAGRRPVAVLLHGGFWREPWERDTIEPLAIDLTRRGYATWSLEYRRVGASGGGWPTTAADVAAGIDHLRVLEREHPIDLERVVFVGHSAGGQLAAWAVRRRGLAAAAEPPPRPRLVVALAGVLDPRAYAERGLDGDSNPVAAYLGGLPDAVPEAYAAASPLEALPLGVPQLVVHGRRDALSDLVDLGRRYVAAARHAGDHVELIETAGDDHFSVLDPAGAAWCAAVPRIDAALAP